MFSYFRGCSFAPPGDHAAVPAVYERTISRVPKVTFGNGTVQTKSMKHCNNSTVLSHTDFQVTKQQKCDFFVLKQTQTHLIMSFVFILLYVICNHIIDSMEIL